MLYGDSDEEGLELMLNYLKIECQNIDGGLSPDWKFLIKSLPVEESFKRHANNIINDQKTGK